MNIIKLTELDMNYVSAVYGVVVLIIVIDWFVRGKRGYRGQSLRHEEVDAHLTGEIVH
jgi:choline transport protein